MIEQSIKNGKKKRTNKLAKEAKKMGLDLVWRDKEIIERKKHEMAFWIPLYYCRDCGHWSGSGHYKNRCAVCQSLHTVHIKTKDKLLRTRMRILDRGGLI